jgi:hypothetical protein
MFNCQRKQIIESQRDVSLDRGINMRSEDRLRMLRFQCGCVQLDNDVV